MEILYVIQKFFVPNNKALSSQNVAQEVTKLMNKFTDYVCHILIYNEKRKEG